MSNATRTLIQIRTMSQKSVNGEANWKLMQDADTDAKAKAIANKLLAKTYIDDHGKQQRTFKDADALGNSIIRRSVRRENSYARAIPALRDYEKRILRALGIGAAKQQSFCDDLFRRHFLKGHRENERKARSA